MFRVAFFIAVLIAIGIGTWWLILFTLAARNRARRNNNRK